jgi:hypothetical protein
MTIFDVAYLGALLQGVAIGLLLAYVVIPAVIDVWAMGQRRRLPAHRRRRGR